MLSLHEVQNNIHRVVVGFSPVGNMFFFLATMMMPRSALPTTIATTITIKINATNTTDNVDYTSTTTTTINA